jgi:hypothetical protein
METNDMPLNQRFQIDYSDEELRARTVDEKIQHFRDGIFDAIAQTIKEGVRGQPPRVDRFRVATSIVEELVSKGVPFGVCPNSKMNKELRRLLNEEARPSDSRKSRRKRIGGGATRRLLRQIKAMRLLGDHFVKIPPYSE